MLLKSEGRLSQKVSSLLVYLSPVYVFQTIYICEKLSRRLSSSRRSCSGNLPNCLCEVRPAYRKSKSSRLAYKHAEIYNLQHSQESGKIQQPSNRFNVHFARMGEPTFNDAVLPFAEFDLKSLVHRFITADTIHPVVSTMLPKANVNLKQFIMEWCRIKNNVYGGEAGLQFSINSTDQAQRNEQFNGKSLSLSEISSLASELPMPVGRKYTLNFAVTADTILDAAELGKLFDKEKCYM